MSIRRAIGTVLTRGRPLVGRVTSIQPQRGRAPGRASSQNIAIGKAKNSAPILYAYQRNSIACNDLRRITIVTLGQQIAAITALPADHLALN